MYILEVTLKCIGLWYTVKHVYLFAIRVYRQLNIYFSLSLYFSLSFSLLSLFLSLSLSPLSLSLSFSVCLNHGDMTIQES